MGSRGTPLLEARLERRRWGAMPELPSPDKCGPRNLAPLFDGEMKEQEPPPVTLSPVKNASPALQLVPKTVAKLATCGRGGEAMVKMLDPEPNWTLHDLRAELGALAAKLDPVGAQVNAPTTTSTRYTSSWSWKQEVADFDRNSKGFVMRAYDEDEDEDEDDLASQSSEFSDVEDDASTEEGTDTRLSPTRNFRMFPARADRLLVAGTGRIEAALFEADRARLLKVQEEMRTNKAMLETAFQEESQRSASRLEELKKEEEAKSEMARRLDKQYQREVAEQRDRYLSALQRDHEQRSQVEERKIRKEEEAVAARNRELAAREEMERQLKAKAEAEAARQEAERAAAAEREKKNLAEAAAVAAAKRAEEEREAKQQVEEAAVQRAAQGPKPLVSKAAAEAEANRMKLLAALDQASTPLMNEPLLKPKLRAAEKQLAKLMVQVTGQTGDLRRISSELLGLLSDSQCRPFVISKMASKVILQWLESTTYALAQLIVAVSHTVPEVMDAVLGKLNSVCILTVPKFYTYHKSSFSSETEHYKIIGYTEGPTGELEATDDYVTRLSGYIRIYAAIIQTPGNTRHGVQNGWRWLAEVLNHLPQNRYTAVALHVFLETAGFVLYRTYGKAFLKLMDTVGGKFIPAYRAKDPDWPSLRRLHDYVLEQRYLKAPQY